MGKLVSQENSNMVGIKGIIKNPTKNTGGITNPNNYVGNRHINKAKAKIEPI